jgi:hypothetical protein
MEQFEKMDGGEKSQFCATSSATPPSQREKMAIAGIFA